MPWLRRFLTLSVFVQSMSERCGDARKHVFITQTLKSRSSNSPSRKNCQKKGGLIRGKFGEELKARVELQKLEEGLGLFGVAALQQLAQIRLQQDDAVAHKLRRRRCRAHTLQAPKGARPHRALRQGREYAGRKLLCELRVQAQEAAEAAVDRVCEERRFCMLTGVTDAVNDTAISI